MTVDRRAYDSPLRLLAGLKPAPGPKLIAAYIIMRTLLSTILRLAESRLSVISFQLESDGVFFKIHMLPQF